MVGVQSIERKGGNGWVKLTGYIQASGQPKAAPLKVLKSIKFVEEGNSRLVKSAKPVVFSKKCPLKVPHLTVSLITCTRKLSRT